MSSSSASGIKQPCGPKDGEALCKGWDGFPSFADDLSRDIDHQLELRGLLNRQFRRIRALQNFAMKTAARSKSKTKYFSIALESAVKIAFFCRGPPFDTGAFRTEFCEGCLHD